MIQFLIAYLQKEVEALLFTKTAHIKVLLSAKASG